MERPGFIAIAPFLDLSSTAKQFSTLAQLLCIKRLPPPTAHPFESPNVLIN
jgi:hypothetical protein